MENILHEPLDNIGGSLRTLHILPFDQCPFIPINRHTNKITSSLSIEDWSKVDFTFDTIQFSHEQISNASGTIYQKVISGSIPKDRDTVSAILKSYHAKRVVVIHTDRNGIRRIIGNKECPAMLFFTNSTGPGPDDQNKFILTISQSDLNPAPYYDLE